MFSCISNYFSHYYNYYFNYNNDYNTDNKTDYNSSNILTSTNNSYINKETTSSLEIQDSYNLLFSTSKNSPKNIKLLFYQMYSNNNFPEYIESKYSTIFTYNNKLFKINLKNNYKEYISIIHTILNYKIKNIIIPEEIYYSKYKKNEYIEIFPYYSDGDLYTYVENNTLTLVEKNNIFTQLINIVNDLHQNNIAHRDIKLENFLIQFTDNKLLIKITDLEFSCIGTTDLTFKGGTIQYTSYELLNFESFTSWYSSDIWSLTVILYILLFNNFPWYNTISYKTYDNNKNNNIEPCIIFNNYLNKNPYEYWNTRLSKILNKNNEYFTIYNHLLAYGFNKNWNERTDICYLQNLLTKL